MNYQEALKNVISWTSDLGKLILEGVNHHGKETNFKSSGFDYVTEYDIKCEKGLIAYIESAYPEHGIVGEEHGSRREDADYVWVIDPIDGTTNYAHGFPFFAISVGLMYKGQTTLGVVHAPMLGYTFTAILGEGAYLNGEVIKTSSINTLEKAIIGTGFPYCKAVNNMNLPYFLKIVNTISGIRRCGAASIDICMVAAGKLDAYWEFYLKPWDYCAGSLILTEAGGTFENLVLGDDQMTIATNGMIKDALKGKLFE